MKLVDCPHLAKGQYLLLDADLQMVLDIVKTVVYSEFLRDEILAALGGGYPPDSLDEFAEEFLGWYAQYISEDTNREAATVHTAVSYAMTQDPVIAEHPELRKLSIPRVNGDTTVMLVPTDLDLDQEEREWTRFIELIPSSVRHDFPLAQSFVAWLTLKGGIELHDK